MNDVNYLLLLKGASDKGGPETSVRGFAKLESAQAAMLQSYREYAVVLGIPVNGSIVYNQYGVSRNLCWSSKRPVYGTLNLV